MAPRPAGPSLVRRVAPVQPVVQRLARGIAQLAHRARHRPAALLDHVDGPALLLVHVARHLRTPNRTDSVQLFVRIPLPTVLGDTHLATATVDRIMHHGRLVEFGGQSRRFEEALMMERSEG